ncbi:extracellular solute-binding protein [Bartonella sp. LJL80]
MKRVNIALWLLLALCGLAQAEPQWRTALSLGAQPKYGENFTHYDYVNVNAPKGGQINDSRTGTFNSFNPYIVMGTPAAGFSSRGGGEQYDTLMAPSTEEPSVNYPLIAEAAQYPDDYSWVKFKLNAKARWHDGQPITADDVVWSFNALKANSPFFNNYYHSVVKAEKTAAREVTFTFEAAGNRELPFIMGQMPVLPQHWWEGTDASGKKRDISAPTLEVPLGSGAYQVASFNVGKSITWKRVKDYWAADLPVNVGRFNFDTEHYSYFLDPNAEWEAFKKGNIIDWRIENRIQRWQQGYTFPAVLRGDVVRQSFAFHGSGRVQGFFINTRRPQFADVRVRKALNLAFDFESLNKSLFFNDYHRISSYFDGLDLAAKGVPQGLELQILETVRNEVPSALFTEAFANPVYDKPDSSRQYLTEAMKLLNEAGWQLKGNRLVNDKGQQFTVEVMLSDPAFERATAPFLANLQRLGIDATMRVVDASQYQNREANYDFDLVVKAIGQSDSPGNEQLEFWGSKAADRPGGYNVAGIKNPAVDTLINRVIYAENRDELVAATRALDRVLLWNYYIIPQWYADHLNIAYWNKFGIPQPQPEASGVDIASWWIDVAKEAHIEAE